MKQVFFRSRAREAFFGLSFFCVWIDFDVFDNGFLGVFKMLEWRDQEHNTDDEIALAKSGTITTFHNCGLLNFFKS